MIEPKRGFMQDLSGALGAARDRAAELLARLGEALSPVREALSRAGEALAPAGRAILAGLAVAAPYISRGLWGLIGLVASVIAWTLALALGAGRRLRAGWAKASPQMTPARVLAAVGAVGAVTLVVSQFMDYRGIAIGTPGYQGSVGTIAPAPQREIETAGSSHLYLLAPVGVAALILIGAALWRDWRLGRAVAALGVLGIAVSLAIDLPKGLDEGTASTAYYGAKAVLVAGFWIQILSCAVLVLCGVLLSRHLRDDRAASTAGKTGSPAAASPASKSRGWPRRLEAGR